MSLRLPFKKTGSINDRYNHHQRVSPAIIAYGIIITSSDIKQSYPVARKDFGRTK